MSNDKYYSLQDQTGHFSTLDIVTHALHYTCLFVAFVNSSAFFPVLHFKRFVLPERLGEAKVKVNVGYWGNGMR